MNVQHKQEVNFKISSTTNQVLRVKFKKLLLYGLFINELNQHGALVLFYLRFLKINKN